MHGKKLKETDVITNENETTVSSCHVGWWKAVISDDVAERIDLGNKLLFVKSVLEECQEINDKV